MRKIAEASLHAHTRDQTQDSSVSGIGENVKYWNLSGQSVCQFFQFHAPAGTLKSNHTSVTAST